LAIGLLAARADAEGCFIVMPGTWKELLKSKVPLFTPPGPPKTIGDWLLGVDMI
jgi:hypothetical protein